LNRLVPDTFPEIHQKRGKASHSQTGWHEFQSLGSAHTDGLTPPKPQHPFHQPANHHILVESVKNVVETEGKAIATLTGPSAMAKPRSTSPQ